MRHRTIVLVLMASAVLKTPAQQGGTGHTPDAQKKADAKAAKKPKKPKLSDDQAGSRSIPPRAAKKDKKTDKK